MTCRRQSQDEMGYRCPYNPEELCRRYEAGEPMADLLRIPPIPEGKTQWEMLATIDRPIGDMMNWSLERRCNCIAGHTSAESESV
jgi:hypothetical protein